MEVIAIPSFNRASTLNKKTLNYLKETKIPIYVFLANMKEF